MVSAGSGALLFLAMFFPPAACSTDGPFISIASLVDSPRSSALGGAASAIGSDPTLAWVNPSSVAGVTSRSLTMGGQRGFIGDVSWSTLGVFPLEGGGGFAAGFAWYDAGGVTLRPAGAPEKNVGVQKDILGMVSAAGVSEGIRAGVSAKLMNSTLLEDYTANAAAFDAGLSVELGGGFAAGVLARNLSGGIRFEKDDVPLPSTVQVGLSGQWTGGAYPPDGKEARSRPFGADRLGVYADAVRDLTRKKTGWGGGVEYRWSGALSARLGAGRRPESSGTGFTLGLGFEGPRYRLDYSTRLEASETAPQLVALTMVL